MDNKTLESETEWIERSRNGDKAAFGLLVRKYMKQAYYTALGFLGSHEDALDASQEAFVKAYRAINRFDTTKRFNTWYYQILRNHCLNILRDQRNTSVPLDILEEYHESLTVGISVEEEVQRAESRKNLWDALWKLSPEDRQIIVARDLLDTPYATMAELMDIPIGTVMSRLYYARRRLRNRLKGVME